jgi:putative copper export protein
MLTAKTPATRILHELGLALSMGGTYFGKFHLDPSVKVISSRAERGQVIAAAWGSFLLSDALGLGLGVATWLKERSRLVRKRGPARMRALIRAKDVLLGTSVLAVVANAISAALLLREVGSTAIPVETGLTAAPEATPRMVKLQHAMTTTSFIHMLATGASLVIR